MKQIKISKLAKDLNVTKATIYNWHKQGKIKFVKSSTNRNFVSEETYNKLLKCPKSCNIEKNVIYCRVSSTENKSNLETQKQRLINYCCAKGYPIHMIITEIGSGINDKRDKLTKLLQTGDYTRIIVEHKDRLTRLGFNYINLLVQSQGKEIEIVNQVNDDKEDLIQDFISIITSYCAKIYGQRRSKRKTEKLIQELQNDQN